MRSACKTFCQIARRIYINLLIWLIPFISSIDLKRLSMTAMLAYAGLYTSLIRADSEFHGTLNVMNNYIWRGYSKTDGKFAIQANLDYETELGMFLGVSVSNVDYDDDYYEDAANVEISPYLGWSFGILNDWRLDVQWTRYIYDGKIFGRKADYNEFYMMLHYLDVFTVLVSFSEDYYNQGEASGNYQLTGRFPITDSFELSANLGYSQTKKTFEYDYLYWNTGLTYYYKFVALDLRYMDAVETSKYSRPVSNSWAYNPELINPSFVFSLSVGF